jgi:uncharacterized membrane protein
MLLTCTLQHCLLEVISNDQKEQAMAKRPQPYPTVQSDDFGTILGNTVKLIEVSWNALVLNINTFLVVYILPTLLILTTLLLLAAASGFRVEDEGLVYGSISALGIAAAITVVFGVVILAIIANIAGIVTQLASARGQVISPRAAFEKSLPLLVPSILLGILTFLIFIVGLIMLIIPGLIALFVLSFAWYILIDKNIGPIATIKETYSLAKQNWKIVLSYGLLTLGIQAISSLTILGALASIVLSVAYLCLPAILYIRMQSQNPAKK